MLVKFDLGNGKVVGDRKTEHVVYRLKLEHGNGNLSWLIYVLREMLGSKSLLQSEAM